MVNKPGANSAPPRAATVARIWLLTLGCAWFLAGFFVGTSGGSRGWGIFLVAVGILHFAAARYARTRLAAFFSSLDP
jgi:hypothetical protein